MPTYSIGESFSPAAQEHPEVVFGEKKSRLGAQFCVACSVVCVCAVLAGSGVFTRAVAAKTPDEPPADTVGMIVGDQIAVEGPMTVRVENGEVKTVVRSGSDVRVKGGQARIELVEGGQIAICGPAHFSLLKSGGSLTLALDQGTVHAQINNEPALTVYTALIQAHPIAIGGGIQDALVGFDSASTMVVRAKSGAVRIEQQLTGQSIVLPQGGDVLLTNGALDGLRSGAGHCTCELQLAKATPRQPEVSMIASAKDVRPNPASKKNSASAAVPDLNDPSEKPEPVYQVFMPPLRYDANARVQDEPDPRMIMLVRRVRVRPTLIYQSEVDSDALVAATQLTPAVAPPKQEAAKAATGAPTDSVVDRVRSFIRKLWTKSS